MSDVSEKINSQYGSADMLRGLREALLRSGKRWELLERSDLSSFEEFHLRGRAATRQLAELVEIRAGTTVLDLGSGVGGPARTLAAEFAACVTGVDLSWQSSRAAAGLTAALRLPRYPSFIQGQALSLPFASGSFQVVWIQHVSMNIDQKRELAEEIGRVLVPHGKVALYEICSGPQGPPAYPLPWASDPSLSFLVAPEELRSIFVQREFGVMAWEDVTASIVTWGASRLGGSRPGTPAPLGLDVVIGPDFAVKTANLRKALEEGRATVIIGVLERPGLSGQA